MADQMFHSTVSNLDRKPSLSSDEDDDIYSHTLPPAGNAVDTLTCLTNPTEDSQDQDGQERDRLKPDQVRQKPD